MKLKKDHRDVTYNFDGVNYVGSYDSEGNYHPPCQPPKSGCSCESKNPTSDEINRAYDAGYEKGATSVIDTVSNWLDEDAVDELRAMFLGEEEDE